MLCYMKPMVSIPRNYLLIYNHHMVVRVAFISHTTLRQLLVHPKGRVKYFKKASVVGIQHSICKKPAQPAKGA